MSDDARQDGTPDTTTTVESEAVRALQDDAALGGLDEARLFQEVGPARRVAEIAAPVARDLGLRLVRVSLQGDGTLQIMAERPSGEMSVDDCANLSRALSPVLDVEDPISGQYTLEVSSSGIDRPLVRPSDFERWEGFEAKVTVFTPVQHEEGGLQRRFRGRLDGLDYDGDTPVVRLETEVKGEDVIIGLPAPNIEEAKLVLTDALIAESLKRQKAAEKERKARKG